MKGWQRVVAWVVLWVALDIVIFAALPGEQSWWAESLVIVGAGAASALVVARAVQGGKPR